MRIAFKYIIETYISIDKNNIFSIQNTKQSILNKHIFKQIYILLNIQFKTAQIKTNLKIRDFLGKQYSNT